MAALSFQPVSEFHDDPMPVCEVLSCKEIATVCLEQTHQDDGESWALCTDHAVSAALGAMPWVANEGEGEEATVPPMLTEWAVEYEAGVEVYDDQDNAEYWAQFIVQPNRVVSRVVYRTEWRPVPVAVPVVGAEPTPNVGVWEYGYLTEHGWVVEPRGENYAIHKRLVHRDPPVWVSDPPRLAEPLTAVVGAEEPTEQRCEHGKTADDAHERNGDTCFHPFACFDRCPGPTEQREGGTG